MAEYVDLHLVQTKEGRTEKQRTLIELIKRHGRVVDNPDEGPIGQVDIDGVVDELKERDDLDFKTQRSYLWQIVGEFFTVLPKDLDSDGVRIPREVLQKAFLKGVEQGLAMEIPTDFDGDGEELDLPEFVISDE